MDDNLEKIEELETELEEQKKSFDSKLEEMTEKLDKLVSEMEEHTHDGETTARVTGSPETKDQDPFWMGNAGIVAHTKRPSLDNDLLVLTSGRDREYFPGRAYGSSNNAELYLDHTDGGLDFFYGFAHGGYVNGYGKISVSATDTFVTDTVFDWEVNELVGKIINISSSTGVFIMSDVVTSNTANKVNFSTAIGYDTNISYTIINPLYLGAAQYPYKRAYVDSDTGGGVRFGIGPTAGGSNGLLYLDSASGLLKFRRPNGTIDTLT